MCICNTNKHCNVYSLLDEVAMKLVGFKIDGKTFVSRRVDAESLELLAEVAEFWQDPNQAANKPGKVVAISSGELCPPVLPSAKIFCIGLNYKAHVAEGSFKHEELPPFPTLFARWTPSLVIDGAPIPVPTTEEGVDWECEVAAFVGKKLVDTDADTARDAVFAYAAFNDITSRRAQKLTSQWILGKNGDNSGPIGDLVTVDEVGDLRDGIQVQTKVNGEVVQDGNTRDMIFELGDVLAHISKIVTLVPGDMIATGTPSGVGYARNPIWLLQPGDEVEVIIEKVGSVKNPIVSNDYRHAK